MKKREDLTRVLALLDKSLRNLTAVKMSQAGKRDTAATSASSVNPWERTPVASPSEINWSVVKSKKSLIDKKN